MAVTIFQQQMLTGFTYDDSYGAYALNINPAPFELTLGENYSVYWDGTTYVCEAQATGEGTLGLGNLSVMGGQGNDEPFIIGWASFGVSIFTFDENTEHEVAIYQGESSDDIVLQFFSGEEREFSGVDMIRAHTADGGIQLFSKGEAVEDVPIDLNFSEGDMTVNAEEDKLMKSVVVKKPETLIPENIPMGTVIAGIHGTKLTEGNASIKEKTLNFFDADGTLLYSYTKKQALALTALPDLPVHEEFGTAYEWNWTLEEIQSGLTTDRYWIDVGATYIVPQTKFFITLRKSNALTVSIQFNANIGYTSVKVDWGDGETTSYNISVGSTQSFSHTYSAVGDYCISFSDSLCKIQSMSGTFTTRKIWLSKNTMYTVSSVPAHEYIVSANYNVDSYISYASLYYPQNFYIKGFVLPRKLSSWWYNSTSTKRIEHWILPPMGLRTFTSNALYRYNYALKRLYVPISGLVGNYAFEDCVNLRVIQFAEGFTGSNYAIGDSCNLETIILPSTFTTAGGNFFYASLKAKIYVPDDMVDTVKAMTNMGVHKENIFPISQIPEDIFDN